MQTISDTSALADQLTDAQTNLRSILTELDARAKHDPSSPGYQLLRPVPVLGLKFVYRHRCRSP